MPRIDPYEERIQAQGAIGAQASPNDFGAQIGVGMQQLASGMNAVADELHQQNETQDITNVHVNMAKARAEWTQTLQDRERSATPGDETFAPTVMKDMASYFEQGANSAVTQKGRALWTSMAANMASEFGQRAIGIQADLAAKDAVNKYTTLMESSSKAVHTDPTQYEATLAQARAAVDDPGGIFAKVPQTTRDQFKQKLASDLRMSASMGLVQTEQGLKTLFGATDTQAITTMTAKAYEDVIKSAAATGGKVAVSPETMAQSGVIAQAAAKNGVNAAVVAAQVDGGANAQQAAVDMSKLLKAFGGNYVAALAASKMGVDELKSLMQQHGNSWVEYLPKDAADYTNGVMAKAGMTPSQSTNDLKDTVPPADVSAQPQASAKSRLSFFNDMTWEQQDAVVKEGIQLQHMRWSSVHLQQEERDYLLKKQREEVTDGYVKKILDPKTNGAFNEAKMANDAGLSYQEKHFLSSMYRTRQRELQAISESRTNPEEVRRLMTHIHAADSNPTKTYNMDETNASYASGRISVNEYRMLRTEVEQMRDGNTSGFGKKAQAARNAVYTSLSRSLVGQVEPEKAADAAYRFNNDLENAIAEKRKQNQDPSSLLDPGSRDYMLRPERISSYLSGTSDTLASAAKKAVAPGTVLNGYKFKGGDPANKNNWEKVK